MNVMVPAFAGPLSPFEDSSQPPLVNAVARGVAAPAIESRPHARGCRLLAAHGASTLVSKLLAPSNGAAASMNLNDNRRCARRTSTVVIIPCATGHQSAKTGRVWPR